MMSIAVRSVCALLQVFDMPASVRFYRDVLGFEIVETSERVGDQLTGAGCGSITPT
jgi:glyoxylase I family protein